MATHKSNIVLVHGFGFDSTIWDPIESAFKGYNVIRLSLPGFGEDGLPGAYTIEALAAHYWSTLSDLPEPFHLVGHSMGGYVIMEMAAQHPDRVGSVTLIHSHVFEDPADRKQKRNEAIESIKTNGRKGFAEKMISGMVGSDYKSQSESLIRELIERGTAGDDNAWSNGVAAMRDRRDLGDTLKNLDVPVLMIMGEEDGAIPLDFVYKQAALASRADLFVLPGVGHLSMYEKTDEVKEILSRFFDRLQS